MNMPYESAYWNQTPTEPLPSYEAALPSRAHEARIGRYIAGVMSGTDASGLTTHRQMPIQHGELLPAVSGKEHGVVRAVIDRCIVEEETEEEAEVMAHLRRIMGAGVTPHMEPEAFDAQAQRMVVEPWYTGGIAIHRSRADGLSRIVTRDVLYMQALTAKQEVLFGMPSGYFGGRQPVRPPTVYPVMRAGIIYQSTQDQRYMQRVVQAQLIAPHDKGRKIPSIKAISSAAAAAAGRVRSRAVRILPQPL